MTTHGTRTETNNATRSVLPASAAGASRGQALAVRSEQAWRELLAAAQVRGFHGTVAIEAAVQDGTIQHLRRRFDRLEK